MTEDREIRHHDGTEEEAKILRAMIEHENTVLNNTVNWALTVQGFLIGTTGIIWSKSQNNEAKIIITLIGILAFFLLISFRHTVEFNRKAIKSLCNENPYKYYPPVIGNYTKHGIFGTIFLIWNALPIFLIIFWTAIILTIWRV